MRKGHLFHAELCHTLAKLGHTDWLAIADAGLPIPDNCQRIDLALTYGIPSFLQVFDSIRQDMQIERVILAEEIKQHNPDHFQQILARLSQLEQQQGGPITLDFVSHGHFKQLTTQCKAIVRTGECTPYANIILQSGVIF